ncbi:cyclin-A1-1-like [Apium graveolens]|uniref:cyclin-A1-1-like n=1 Tax=Apium graveolens TaxID=4045 RepID=UPI003D78DDFC
MGYVTEEVKILAPAAELELIYGNIVDVDNNPLELIYHKILDNNPGLCATMVREIYDNLRASEAKKRPCSDYMTNVQKDIDIRMRATLIDWLVEVVEFHSLDPEILYLTVNYLDRYLSANPVNTETLQLLGITCLMLASKYVDTDSPPLEHLSDLTHNSYSPDDIRDMECIVLGSLNFELTVPTARCFLECFVRVAEAVTGDTLMDLECMSNYLAELSLRDYHMLRYSPSVIAASSVFLARYILLPSRTPWNSMLQHLTLYKPLDLSECVKQLHSLCCNSLNSSFPAIRVKYSHHKYNCVAKKYCPPSIPREYFRDL